MDNQKTEFATVPLPMLLGADENRNVALMFLEPPRLLKQRDGAPERRWAIMPALAVVGAVTLVIAAVAQSLIA